MDGVPWSEQSKAQEIARLDVGIMPLVDAPFERDKCGYKLIQYMACGLSVVASPVGKSRLSATANGRFPATSLDSSLAPVGHERTFDW